MQVDPDHTQRNQAIEAIERSLYNITGMFKQFGALVNEHQVMVDRIDKNTADALDDIEAAQDELRQTHENVADNRKLMLKIFFILMIFVTFYIVVVL